MFPNLSRYYKKKWKTKLKNSWDPFTKLLSKGHFPYEYLSSPDVFEGKTFPPKHAFRNRLKDSDISEQDYLEAQNIWDTFKVNI